MADYRLTTEDPDGPVERVADRAFIPNDPLNMDWVAYLAWREDGNTPDPMPQPPAPPNPPVDLPPPEIP